MVTYRKATETTSGTIRYEAPEHRQQPGTSPMTEYDVLVTACWLFGGIGLCILAVTLVELYATATATDKTHETEEEDDPAP